MRGDESTAPVFCFGRVGTDAVGSVGDAVGFGLLRRLGVLDAGICQLAVNTILSRYRGSYLTV